MAYYGGRGGGGGRFGGGRGRGGGGGSGGGRFPWGAGGGWGYWGVRGQWWGAGAGETLAKVMAMRAPPPSSIRPEAMRAAEAAAREVVLRVHPTVEAEQRRQDVISYVRRLIGTSLGAEVFAFGSVPLKTYLPDGDVDVTVLGSTSLDSTFIDDVRSVLESEVQNKDAEFELKGLQFINAEVKLIKCVIENIVVDISFNQVGGVSTLCFLELVDQEVGKDHLFKKSIILIKTWCYHESRILGAHHGLISTYGLETLVLYIFNIFHKSLNGPLEALYTFLEYFSKFDWENYCVSLNGPIAFSALPNLTDHSTAIYDELVLGKECIKDALGRLLVLPEDSGGYNSNFRLKHLNIVDPLKGSNNLGRSVSKGSFYRIQSAFAFGAQKLGQILLLPSEFIPDEIYGFFANTLDRHGTGERPDLGNSGLFQSFLGPEMALSEDLSDLEISNVDEEENRSPHNSLELPDKESNVKPSVHKTSSRYLPGDAHDRPWNKIWYTMSAADYKKIVSRANFSTKLPYLASYGNNISFSPENDGSNTKHHSKDSAREEYLPPSRSFVQRQICANGPHILASSTRTNTSDATNSCPVSESSWTDLHEEKLLLSPFSPNLLNLSGDLDSHLGCLRKVQYHLESLFDGFLQSVQEAFLAGVLDENSFDIPTVNLTNTDARPPGLSLASSTDTERWNTPPVYCSQSTGNDSQQAHAEVQTNAVYQQNVALPSGTYTLCNRMPLSPPPVSNPENYHVWFHTTGDIPKMHATDAYLPQNGVMFPSGTDFLSSGLALSPSTPAGTENYPVSWPCIIGDIPKTRGTGTYIPKMGQSKLALRRSNLGNLKRITKASYDTYKERISSEKGRKQKLSLLDRLIRIHCTLYNNLQRCNSFEQGHYGPSNELIAVQNAIDQILMKQNNSQQGVSSRKSLVPHRDAVSIDDQASTDSVTKQMPSKVQNKQHGSNMNTVGQKSEYNGGLVGSENQLKEIPASSTSQPSSPATKGYCQLDDNLEFGSLGTYPLRLLPEFNAAFPPLPTRKGPAEVPASSKTENLSEEACPPLPISQGPGQVPASTIQNLSEEAFPPLPSRLAQVPASAIQKPTSPGATRCRPQGSYVLRDEVDFPPLKGGGH